MGNLARTTFCVCLVTAVPGCSTFEFLVGDCEIEYIEVSWPATIEQGGNSELSRLLDRIAPSNVSGQEFDRLKGALIRGEPQSSSLVIWSVGAFSTNGGYVSITHPAPSAVGAVIPVTSAFNGGGWGTVTGRPSGEASVAVRASGFVAASATGSLTVLDNQPLKMRIDFTARSATNESMRISGEAQFGLRREKTTCT